MSEPELERLKAWNLARLELAADTAADLQDEMTLRIRGARASGATLKEIAIASRLSESQVKRLLRR